MKKFGRHWVIILAVLLAAVLAGCGGGKEQAPTDKKDQDQAASSETVVLKAVSAWPEKIRDNTGLFYLREEVEKRSGGKLKIQYLGGPEVIPNMEQINAVKNGSVDISWLSFGYTVSLVPEANAGKLTKFTPDQERQNGYNDLFNEIYQKKANAVFLGRGIPGVHFQLYTNFPVKTLDDFKGKPIRVTPSYKDLVQALGASPVTIDPGEVFTALERGTVDGYGWPAFGIADWGWDTKTKYVIEPGFYQADPMALINKDKYNSLSEENKRILAESVQAMQGRVTQFFADVVKQDREQLLQKGIQVQQLSQEDSGKFIKLADDAVMEQVIKASPEYGPKLKEILLGK